MPTQIALSRPAAAASFPVPRGLRPVALPRLHRADAFLFAMIAGVAVLGVAAIAHMHGSPLAPDALATIAGL